MVSIRKLAELAGASHTAVWFALQNKPGVSPEMRARILALAEEYHYRPNRLVEGLITGNTRTIGHITEHSTWYFYSRLCAGIISAAYYDRVHAITINAAIEQPRPPVSQFIEQLIEQRVDGIILSVGQVTLSTKSVLEMWSHDIVPVLIGDSMCEKPLDWINTDERQLAYLAVDYLLHLGHRHIAYCGLDRQRSRNQQMYQAFQARGLSLECFIHEAMMTAPDPQTANAHLDFFQSRVRPPTAIICFEDCMAMQLLLHAQKRGLRVPGDLSILGCSNNIVCGFLTPALTTIEQYPEEIGRRAYELVQRRRQEGEEPGKRKPETILVAPKLVIRESCGPPGKP